MLIMLAHLHDASCPCALTTRPLAEVNKLTKMLSATTCIAGLKLWQGTPCRATPRGPSSLCGPGHMGLRTGLWMPCFGRSTLGHHAVLFYYPGKPLIRTFAINATDTMCAVYKSYIREHIFYNLFGWLVIGL